MWKAAGIAPTGSWYMPAGQGMGAVLTITEGKQGYTITDRGTWLAYRDKLSLQVLAEGDERLHNPYGVIAVNPARHPHVQHQEAMLFVDWLTSPAGQKAIGDFRKDGERLFIPDAIPER